VKPEASLRTKLLETIEAQQLGCELQGSTLYASLLDAMAGDVAKGGPVARLLASHMKRPFGDAVLLRVLGGLHLLVLEGRAPALARHYPSVGGSPAASLSADLVDTVEHHGTALEAALAHPVQTNEVGRSTALISGYLYLAGATGLPLRLREIGASAGLNLLADRFRYEDTRSGSSLGPAHSPLRFVDPWFAKTPDLEATLRIEDRRGSDLAPIDVATRAGCQRLRSFVWADQADRLDRLDAALEVAQADPPTVDAASAPDWLATELAAPAPGSCTVVTHSIMFQYLNPLDRQRTTTVIEDAGRKATKQAPLAWLRLEPGGDQAELRLTLWPSGKTRVLARSSYHGPPVVWLAG